jgi:hypothetical protein
VCTAEAILALELPLMLETLGDKERKVQLAAENAINAFRDMLGDSASMLSLLPALTASFGATKFKTQISALNFVAHIARTLPKLVGNHMILLVPAIEAMLHDLKEETAAAANECMKVLHQPAYQLAVKVWPHIRHRLALTLSATKISTPFFLSFSTPWCTLKRRQRPFTA